MFSYFITKPIGDGIYAITMGQIKERKWKSSKCRLYVSHVDKTKQILPLCSPTLLESLNKQHVWSYDNREAANTAVLVSQISRITYSWMSSWLGSCSGSSDYDKCKAFNNSPSKHVSISVLVMMSDAKDTRGKWDWYDFCFLKYYSV